MPTSLLCPPPFVSVFPSPPLSPPLFPSLPCSLWLSKTSMEQVLVFRDINPQAPTHLLVIPKKREGLTQLRYAEADHASLLGHMLSTIAKVQLV